jgi:hypothetical protein
VGTNGKQSKDRLHTVCASQLYNLTPLSHFSAADPVRDYSRAGEFPILSEAQQLAPFSPLLRNLHRRFIELPQRSGEKTVDILLYAYIIDLLKSMRCCAFFQPRYGGWTGRRVRHIFRLARHNDE